VRRLLILALLLAACGCTAPGKGRSTMKVFILAGQSNMAGTARPEELPEQLRTPPLNVYLWRNGRWGPLTPWEQWGPELSFGHAMARAWPQERIGIVKLAVGGTSLAAWAPDWSAEQAALTGNAGVGPLYARLMQRVRLALESEGGRVVGMVWMQGERDCRYAAAAAVYDDGLRALIERVRRDLHEAELPFVIGQVNPPAEQGYPYADVVRAAQERVAGEVPHTALVSTDGLPKRADGLHYAPSGLEALGERLAEAYLRLAPGGARRRPMGLTIRVEVTR